MNRIIATLLFSLVFISCNESKKKGIDIETTVEEQNHNKTATSNKKNDVNNYWINEIELDNGIKWNANIETTQGVNAMLSTLDKSNANTIEDYISLASNLNHEKNFVIKKCTMKGDSHDNLHIFLLPLIEKIDLLSQIKTTDEGKEIEASIKENLEAYSNYFK